MAGFEPGRPLLRDGESLRDAAHRNAIDAAYYERDHDGTMHTAGAAAADVALAVVVEFIRNYAGPLTTWDDVIETEAAAR